MRKVYIDNLRCGIIVLVILYHIVYQFNSLGIIRNVTIQGYPQLDILMYIMYPWFMVCLFLLAGISARYALQKRTAGQFLKERTRKLLIPSVAGIFLIGWICGFVTNQYTDMFIGAGEQIPGLVKYLIYCLCGIGPLWFMHELYLATLLLLLLRKLDKGDRIWLLGGKVKMPVICLLFFAAWGSAQIFNTPLIEIYRNGIYIFYFLIGYYVFSHEEVLEEIKKFRYVFLMIAALLGIAYTCYYLGENYTTMTNLKSVLTNAYAWFMTVALLGGAQGWWNRETRFTTYMRPRSFGFYILHYPLMTIVTYWADTIFHVPLWALYVISLVVEIVLLPIVYEILNRIPLIRSWVLGQSKTS